MPYNDAFTKMVGDTSATFKTEITAVQDNVTDEIGAPVLEGGKYQAKGDLNAIIQEIINNDVLLKAIADKLRVDLDGHASNKNNPHATTKGQVGLGNVENYTVTSSLSDPSNTKYTTAGAVKALNDSKFNKDGGEITNNIILNQNKSIRIKKEGGNDWGEWALGYTSADNSFSSGLLSSGYMTFSNANPKLTIGSSQYTYYHTGNKPTANDVGAVAKSGDTMSGTLSLPRMKISDRIITDTFSWGEGAQVMDIEPDRLILGNGNLVSLCFQVAAASGAKVMVGSEFFTLYHTGYKPSKTDVGLSKVDNTSDVEKSVLSATKLKTARDITIGSSTKQFDGQSNITYSLSEIGALPANGDRDILISSNRAIRVIPADGEASVYGIGYTSADETFNVGIGSKKLKLWCNGNPQVKINGTDRYLYHTGNLNIQNTIKNQIVSKISVSQNTKTVIYTSPTLTGFSDTDIFYAILDENGGGETKVFTIPFGILRNLASRQSEGSGTGLFATTYALETAHIVRFFIDTDGALKGQCLTSGWHLIASGVVGGSFAG